MLVLASPNRIAEAMAAAGVGDGTTAVLYDDTLAYHAARAWWSLRAYGFESARVLDGGYPAWTDAALPDRRPGTRSAPRGAVHAPARGAAPPSPRRTCAASSGAPDVLLVDARGPAEFHGYEGNVRRLGHIPGAVNVPVAAMHQPGTQRLRDPADLRTLLLKANVTRGRRLVCYDQSGVAAAKLAWVLCAPRPRGRRACTTAAGPSGARAWTCRSTSSGRRRPAARARSAGQRAGRGPPGAPPPIPAHGSTSWCCARICVRRWLTATSSAERRPSPSRSDQ